jgi:hypothetical protein
VIHSGKFNPFSCKNDHPEEEQTMTPSLNVRRSVGPGAITNWKINDFQSQLCSAKDQVIVAEWIEVPKIRPIGIN